MILVHGIHTSCRTHSCHLLSFSSCFSVDSLRIQTAFKKTFPRTHKHWWYVSHTHFRHDIINEGYTSWFGWRRSHTQLLNCVNRFLAQSAIRLVDTFQCCYIILTKYNSLKPIHLTLLWICMHVRKVDANSLFYSICWRYFEKWQLNRMQITQTRMHALTNMLNNK